VLALWRGATPTVFRAMAINFGMLGPYDQFKDIYTGMMGGPSKTVNVMSSFSAATIACVMTLPFDNVKTKF
jgi:solute carrier family 25 oxoglutarate transporter 11